jgi:hypothetical protein
LCRSAPKSVFTLFREGGPGTPQTLYSYTATIQEGAGENFQIATRLVDFYYYFIVTLDSCCHDQPHIGHHP